MELKAFKAIDLACGCCGELPPNNELCGESVDFLNKLQEMMEVQLIVNSAHRCEARNAKVGGALNSMHLQVAFDIQTNLMIPAFQAQLIKKAKAIGFRGVGIYKSFTHLDMGKNRTWKG